MATETPRPRYTVVASLIKDDAWHVVVVELPETWTVAFSSADIEDRARMRIAFDTRLEPDEFDIDVRRVRNPVRA